MTDDMVWVTTRCTTCGNDQAEQLGRYGEVVGHALCRFRLARQEAERHRDRVREAVCVACGARTMVADIESDD